jgi:hypothetical protein
MAPSSETIPPIVPDEVSTGEMISRLPHSGTVRLGRARQRRQVVRSDGPAVRLSFVTATAIDCQYRELMRSRVHRPL